MWGRQNAYCTKRGLLHFFFLLPPTQLFHRDADVVAVAKSGFRHDCVRIRALCNEFWRARAVSSQIPVMSNPHKWMQPFTNAGGDLTFFQLVYQNQDNNLAMEWHKDARPDLGKWVLKRYRSLGKKETEAVPSVVGGMKKKKGTGLRVGEYYSCNNWTQMSVFVQKLLLHFLSCCRCL